MTSNRFEILLLKTLSEKPKHLVRLFAAALLFSLQASPCQAASVDVSVAQSASGPEGSTLINLTEKGPLDWAIWATPNTLTPSDSMNGGAGFTSLTLITGATQSTASFGNPENAYSWTNGTAAVSATGITNAARATFTSVGGGVRLTVAVAGAGSYHLSFHTTTSGAITISGTASLLTGGVTNTAAGAAQTTLFQSEYSVNFTTDGADTLTLDVVKTAGTGNIFAYEAFTLAPLAADLQVASSASYLKGGTSSQSLQLPFRNLGNGNLNISSVTLGGADASSFTIDSFTSPLAAGGSGSIAFTFNPTAGNRTYNATFTINSNDPDSPATVVNISALRSAASIGVSVAQSVSGTPFSNPVNLTTEGTLDWGIWQNTQRALTNRMAGGSGFASLTLIAGAADTAATFNNPENVYNWTNATSPPTTGNSNGGTHARASLANIGDGVRLTVGVASAGSYQLIFHSDTSNTISVNGTASLASGATDIAVGALNTLLEKCKYTVNFTTGGADTLTLDIVKTGGSSAILAFEAFTLKTSVVEPDLQVASSASYNAGATSLSLLLPYNNLGAVNLNITTVVLGGADASFFTIDSFTSPVAPSGSGNVAFTFNPTAGYRAYNATFTIASNDPDSPSVVVNISVMSAAGLGNVICIGDSITEADATRPAGDGNWSWRYPFWKHLVDSDISHQFVGTRTANHSGSSFYPTYQGLSFMNNHEAIWGTTALERGNSAATYLGTLKSQGKTPDTAIVYCGTNDAVSADAATIRNRVKSIVDQLQGDTGVSGNSRVRILLISIIPRFTGAPSYTTPSSNNTSIYPAANALLEQLAITETTATSKVSFLDIFPLFSSNNPMILYDGTHPNGAGEQIEADNIFAALVPDTDGDNLSDTWERLYFNNLTSTATGDPDGDGLSNSQEFLFGTNPKSANAGNLLTLSPDRTSLSFTLPAATGIGYEGRLRRYALESTPDLNNWSVEQAGIADGGTVTVTVPVSPGMPRLFFHLKVTLD